MLFVGTSIIHPSTEGVFLLCNILDLLIYSYYNKKIKSYELYPKTLEDGIVSNGDMEGSYYYNPRVSFYDAEQIIINAFLEFVELDLKVRK